MREMYLQFMKYNQAANREVFALLDGLSNDEREAGRGSYYDSLSGLMRHIAGGSHFFAGIFRGGVAANTAAQKALAPLAGQKQMPEGRLSAEQWAELGRTLEAADEALVTFAAALTDADMAGPITTEWYGGKPPQVPLSFMLNNFITHGIHHRGQVSQILDSLKIDNNFSGISVSFLN
jgi:uncharacterized damage-inducible protein DinB